MAQRYVLTFISGISMTLGVQAQDCASGRYVDPDFFSGVTVTQGVAFGSNTGVGGGEQVLRMDVYEPEGDLMDGRPVVLVAFGGSFITGTRGDVAPICEAFARRGYVAIACDYRVGFFFPNEASTTRAVMRGAHDMKACVRYLRRTFEEMGDPYRIDPDRIIVGGVSAGAISAVHCTYLNEESEVPAVLSGEAASFGGVEGNSGNPGFSSDVLGCYSFSGAIGDTAWIVPGDKPMASIHEVGDNVVPYYTQEVSVIGIPTGLVASGSHDIHLRFDHLGIANCFLSYPTSAHVGYLQTDELAAMAFVSDFMADLVCGEAVACDPNTSISMPFPSRGPIVRPNPTHGPLTLELERATRVVVLDARGLEVMADRLPAGTVRMDLSDLPPGTYFLRTSDGPTGAVRVVLMH